MLLREVLAPVLPIDSATKPISLRKIDLLGWRSSQSSPIRKLVLAKQAEISLDVVFVRYTELLGAMLLEATIQILVKSY